MSLLPLSLSLIKRQPFGLQAFQWLAVLNQDGVLGLDPAGERFAMLLRHGNDRSKEQALRLRTSKCRTNM